MVVVVMVVVVGLAVLLCECSCRSVVRTGFTASCAPPPAFWLALAFVSDATSIALPFGCSLGWCCQAFACVPWFSAGLPAALPGRWVKKR
eukprot:8584991-Pyramimonas_sp.AAC.1